MSSTKAAKLDETLLQFKLPATVRNALIAMIGVGVVSFLIAFLGFGHETSRHMDEAGHFHHTNLGYHVLLIGTYFVVGLAITGIFFTAIQHLTGSHWSVTVRRLFETYGLFTPIAGLLLIGVIFGMHDLYEWADATVRENDHLIHHKSGYLNPTAFIIRCVLFIGVWSIFAYIFHGKSVGQDKDKVVDTTKTLAKISGGFILFFALSWCFMAFDLLMSLTPHWFSTMFGVYAFAGAFQTSLASYLIVIAILKKNGFLGEAVNENHYHDIAKFLLGMTTFWAYVGFSQFMLIWYANIPEETFFYEMRMTGGWGYATLALPFVKFVIPFLLLLNRPNKRDINFLWKIATWILVTQFFELFWLVFPANFEKFSILHFVLAFGGTVGVVGIFGFFIFKKLEKHSLVPVGDPRLSECLHHNQ
ncbi:hypothetical protein [Leptospira brenneri]|uniref:Quinol:cytochrome C oxidoreductase n=1 Tax=Leptospira brenneri TaxID=2023182 RepID=A0A2M9Y300_9LEPT|nr:hypothetical protein [Leptospira brenneri]PJZ45964.1 hypothetical protein CH361_08305 [Leptospira brenneri]TGK91382.1 hypothetical protein EHQ30_14235 [Leptospira brenneri]